MEFLPIDKNTDRSRDRIGELKRRDLRFDFNRRIIHSRMAPVAVTHYVTPIIRYGWLAISFKESFLRADNFAANNQFRPQRRVQIFLAGLHVVKNRRSVL